jgi:hypothetical protein
MMASRGMGAVLPSKMPKGSRKARRDDTDFTQFDQGGSVSDKEKDDAVKFGVDNPRLNLAKDAKELAGRLTAEKQLSPNTSLQAYLDAKMDRRGPGVQGGGVKLTHRFAEGGAVGLYANINAKRKRIAAGSKEKMRKPGQKGAPTADAFVQSAKTAKK